MKNLNYLDNNRISKVKGALSHRVHDPVHGYIYLEEYERKLVDSLLFQRLRGIYFFRVKPIYSMIILLTHTYLTLSG